MLPVTIDFETHAIDKRPNYPPEPVGVAIKFPGKKPHYYAWGHPTGNNCNKTQAEAALALAWIHPGGILCHNSKFDYEVGVAKMGMPGLAWYDIHDTMFLAFLSNPHAPSFALKPTAERLLGMPPEERDAVRQWLRDNDVCATKDWGAFISRAPGDLVGSYAVGDVVRTEKLFSHLMPEIKRRGMTAAYDRERELMPILVVNERQGVKVSWQLEEDVAMYGDLLKKVDGWIHKKLENPFINIDADEELMAALITRKLVDTSLLGLTATGVYRADKAALERAVTDKRTASMLRYRGALATCLRTFMVPWLNTSKLSGGRIFTQWNQLKDFAGRGTVTGRLSSTPNFQNIPKAFPMMFKEQAKLKLDHAPESMSKKERKAPAHLVKTLPTMPFGMPDLPLVRSYIVPDEGMVLIDRDYSQQELRVLGHFEDGELLRQYNESPWMDIHDVATELVSEATGTPFERKAVKTTGFGLIYGMGIGRLAAATGLSLDAAKQLKAAYLSIFPGLRELMSELKKRAMEGQPYSTWGGREYFCEQPKIINGEIRTFEYKMLNVLIQGSSADMTKQAIINYHKSRPEGHELLINVHDELLAQCPADEIAEGQDAMREAMTNVKFDVPMLSEGKFSHDNWAALEPYDKKGEVLV